MTNNPNVDVNEVYGDGMGKSGNGAEQADIAQKSLRYQDRFVQDRKPNGHDMGDVDRVRG
jgi:hypothetical protein